MVHLNFSIECLVIQNLLRVALTIVRVAVIAIHRYLAVVLGGRSSAVVERFHFARLARGGTQEVAWDLAFI